MGPALVLPRLVFGVGALARLPDELALLGVQRPLLIADRGLEAAGIVANVAPAPGGGFDALVVAQIEALKGGTLALGALDGEKLMVKSLPYLV